MRFDQSDAGNDSEDSTVYVDPEVLVITDTSFGDAALQTALAFVRVYAEDGVEVAVIMHATATSGHIDAVRERLLKAGAESFFCSDESVHLSNRLLDAPSEMLCILVG